MERLTYTNANGEAVEFSHRSVYHTNQVTGLSDTRNDVFTIQSMGQDGDTHVGGRIARREIMITGAIREIDKDRAFQLRRWLARVTNPHLPATLTYRYGDIVRVIDCVPENAPTFSREAVFLDYELILTCPNPFWRDVKESVEQIAEWIPLWEFPFEIPSDTGMEFGYRAPSLIATAVNRGDVKSGMRVEFRAVGPLTDPSLLDINTREFIKLNCEMAAGDVITVTTYYGRKSVRLRHGGVESDAFHLLDPDSTYLMLDIGANQYRFDAESNLDNLEVTIYHNNSYLSV